MNIPYLLKILETNKISELVKEIDLAPLDIFLAISDGEKAGQLEVDRDKDKIKALIEPEITFDADLASKLLRVLQQYESKELNITCGTLNRMIKDPVTGIGYPYHDYLMALDYLITSGQIIEDVISVPKNGKRPYHKFVFLCFPSNDNEQWNKNEINSWIASWQKNKVQ